VDWIGDQREGGAGLVADGRTVGPEECTGRSGGAGGRGEADSRESGKSRNKFLSPLRTF
jgi:hypothetical protein